MNKLLRMFDRRKIKVPKGKSKELDKVKFDHWEIKDIEQVWLKLPDNNGTFELTFEMRYSFGAYCIPISWLQPQEIKTLCNLVDVVD